MEVMRKNDRPDCFAPSANVLLTTFSAKELLERLLNVFF
jgi:hypothetical protein